MFRCVAKCPELDADGGHGIARAMILRRCTSVGSMAVLLGILLSSSRRMQLSKQGSMLIYT